MPTASENVRLWGKSGSNQTTVKTALMTHRGHGWSLVTAMRSLTGKNTPFDRTQPDAGCNERKASIHRAHCAEFTIVPVGSCCSRPSAPATRGAFALWTRTCCNVQTRLAQRSCPDDYYRFPGPCL